MALAGETTFDGCTAILLNLKTTVEDYTSAGGLKKLLGSGSPTAKTSAKVYDRIVNKSVSTLNDRTGNFATAMLSLWRMLGPRKAAPTS